MSTSKSTSKTRHCFIRLSSPQGDDKTHLLQWQFAMKWALKSRKLWYLIEGPLKVENGISVSSTVQREDSDALISFILENIHEDNIGFIMDISDPKLMWQEPEEAHLLNSLGYHYYYLQMLMALSTPEKDGIKDHLMQIDTIRTSLNKICVDGKISIDDIEVAALTASLPSTFSLVTSHFKRKSEVRYKEGSNAVWSAAMNNKSCINVSNLASTDHSVKSTSEGEKSKGVNSWKKKKDTPPLCSHCDSPHHSVKRCLKKQNVNLRSTIETLVKKVDAIVNAKMAYEDDSDYSDLMACWATLPSAL